MNLRFPVVAAIVAVAAGSAGFRALHPPAPVAALAVTPPIETGAAGDIRNRAAAPHPASRTIVVYVAGEVVRAGVYTVPVTARGADALRAAGGALADADLVAVNLATRLADGDEVAVPARGAVVHRATRKSASSTSSTRPHTSHKRKLKRRHPASSGDPAADLSEAETPTELVDLNEADVDVLQTLPGIGPALAERIIAVRDQSGPFVSTDDLLDVGGMTQSKVDAIAPYVTLR